LQDGGVSLRKYHHSSLQDVLIHIVRIAQTIQIMLQNNIVHLDMHLGNMMSSGVSNCKVIDFGLSKTSKTFYSPLNFLWTTEYAVNPPEFRLVQTRRKKNNNLAIEQQILAKYLLVDESYLNHIYMNPLFIDSYEQLNSSIVSLRQNEKYSKKIALDYLQSMNTHETTDVYGLGVAIIEIITKKDFPEVSLDTYMKLWDVITKMIMPHPKDRMPIATVINELKSLLEHLETDC
jgi:serine/threonine protein kinase